MKKLMFAIVLFVLVLSCVACDNNAPTPSEAQNTVTSIVANPVIHDTASNLEKTFNHDTGINIPVPCASDGAPGCMGEIVNTVKNLGK